MMRFSLSKMQKLNVTSYFYSKFFAVAFSAIISALTNIARESTGLIYKFGEWVFACLSTHFNTSTNLWDFIKNNMSILARCADVTFNVIFVFVVVFFVIRFLQRVIYSKVFPGRRKFLKELLWEDIISNILEIGETQKNLISQIGKMSPEEIECWYMVLANMYKIQKEIIFLIEKEGIFEHVGNKSKYYVRYLNDINFPLVYIIFKEEESLLRKVDDAIRNMPKSTIQKKLSDQSEKICDEFHLIINTLNTNIS